MTDKAGWQLKGFMAAAAVSALVLGGLSRPVWADTTLKVVEVIPSPARTALLQQEFASFEQSHPGIKVQLTSLPWSEAFEKFLNMVQAGDTPDIVEMPDRWLGLYANNDQLLALNDDFKSTPSLANLSDRALQFGSAVRGKLYEIPYGFYVRGLFWNKKLFAQAGLSAPPATLAEFVADSKKISALPGKYGYCLRGGPGGFSGITMFMNTTDGQPGYFHPDGTSTMNDPGSIEGLQLLATMYKDGSAPPDSVNWGFNEIVAGFDSGTCAMLDQDPDALIGIAGKMNADDFAVAPIPVGPGGKAYPTLGYGGWSIFANSDHKDAAWQLLSFMVSPDNNLAWSKVVGTLPIYKNAGQNAYFQSDKFKGWFTELNDSSKYVLVTPPTYLEGFGDLYDNISIKTFQQVLLGQRTAKDVADQWAAYLTDQLKAYKAHQKAN
jgi:multiple sugar transport system substrate-binding protein